MNGDRFLIIFLILLSSCSNDTDSNNEKNESLRTRKVLDSLENSKLESSNSNLQYQSRFQERTWKNKDYFLKELSIQKEVTDADRFHEYLHSNFDYSELLELTKSPLKHTRAYGVLGLRKYDVDTLYDIAIELQNDTAMVITVWEGQGGRHINCYSIAQIAAQSVLWYENKSEINAKQNDKMEAQMNAEVKPISEECGRIYTVNRDSERNFYRIFRGQ